LAPPVGAPISTPRPLAFIANAKCSAADALAPDVST
jgi:hypothetical protein